MALPIGNPATAAAAQPTGMQQQPQQPQQPRQKQPAPQPRPPMAPKQQPTPQAPPAQPQQPQFAQGGMAQQPQQPPMQGPARSPPPKGATRNQDAPIPGQSLTSPPGSFPYEKPPKFTDPDKAMASILNAFTEEKTAYRLLNMMELGVPVFSIVSGFMMSGFAEGKWTPDLALLLMEPTTALLMRMAKAAGIEPVIGVPEDEDPSLEQVASRRAEVSAEEVKAAVNAGLMSRPKGK